MSSPEPELTAKQQLAATALARGASVEGAAGDAGATVRTVVRWRSESVFQQAVIEIRREIHAQAVGKIVASLTTAVDALASIAGDLSAPASSRVSAAKALLDSAYRSMEAAEIESRLLAVELSLEEFKKL